MSSGTLQLHMSDNVRPFCLKLPDVLQENIGVWSLRLLRVDVHLTGHANCHEWAPLLI